MNRSFHQAILVYLGILISITALVHLPIELPLVGHLGSAMLALLLLCSPFYLARRNGVEIEDYGYSWGSVREGLLYSGMVLLVLLPLFTVGFLAFYEFACSPSSPLKELSPTGFCRRFLGYASPHMPSFGWDEVNMVLVNFIVVALPEELFFRGYLQTTLEKAFPAKRSLWGAKVGLALVLSSLCFALVHVPAHGDLRSLATFFPSLIFGWLRTKTGSIFASTVAHASCNVWIKYLEQIFFR